MNTTSNQAREIFVEALQWASPKERSDFLDAACVGDSELRTRVERLLASHQALGSYREDQGEAPADSQPGAEPLVGAQIGPYKLRELLGEGGMGSVYVAEQDHPVRRKVALKVIKPGMDSRQVLGRFEAERQVLAMMDHPNIARVLDAGVTDLGAPYFVMELVKGVPITEFCDQRRLVPRERIALFIQVCRAIQHAHQKGVIHRDIKPSNILVTLHDDLAVPVVIDFGIAKATGQQLAEETIYTAFNQLIGSPLYMSPEQAEMNALDVDTRSDVYSLGVLLYELMTGSTPFASDTFREAGFDEMRRMIREVDPPRPSQRLSTLAGEAASTVSQVRGVDTRRLQRTLRGDLDWVVMKALEKDRNRRYESASALAEDLQRHLNGDAVLARPPQFLAGARKWCRKRAGVLASAVAVLAVSTTILAVSSMRIGKWYREAESNARRATSNALEARRNALEATAAAEESGAVINFLLNDLLAGPQEADKTGKELTLNDVLSNADSKVAAAFADQPRLEAFLRVNLARTFNAIRNPEAAERNARRALELGMQEPDTSPRDLRLAAQEVAASLLDQGRREEAIELCETVLARLRLTRGSAHPEVIRLTAARLKVGLLAVDRHLSQTEIQELGELCRQHVRSSAEVFAAEHPDAIEALQILSVWANRYGTKEEGAEMNHELLEVMRRKPEPDQGLMAVVLSNEAATHKDAGREREAIPLLKEALAIHQRTEGLKNEKAIAIMSELADCHVEVREDDQAREIVDTLLSTSQQMYGPGHGRTVGHMLSLVADAGYRVDIRPYSKPYDVILGSWDQSGSVGSLPDHSTRRKMACVLAVQGRGAEARHVVDEIERLIDAGDFLERDQLAWMLATSPIEEVRDGERAVKLAKQACEICSYQEPSPIDTLAAAYAESGDFEEAVRWSEKALAMSADEPRREARYTKHLECFKRGEPWREEL